MGIRSERIAFGAQRAWRRIDSSRVAILLAAFLVSVGIGYLGYQRVFASSAPATPVQMATVTRGTIAATVGTTGSVVPNRQAKLTFSSSGTVSEVAVSLGDKVKAGQVLARLDTGTLENKLAQAQSSLRAAQIKLEQLKTGGTPEEIAAAKASLASAQAKYNDLVKGPSEGDVKAAEQAVASAQANLTKAQSDLAKLKAGPSQDEITVVKADLEKKQAALVKAQADYDKVAWRGDIAARPEAVALQQATSDYQVALANYNIKMAQPKPEDIAVAEKAVESAAAALASAQAKLDQLRAGPTAADVQSAKAALESAKAQLAVKTGSPSPLDLAAAEEQVKQAELSVRQAETDLAKASLTAPFDGVVAAVSLNVGEQSSNGFITLVDTSSVRIDVTVAEADLGKVSLDKTALVTFDALPGTQLQGKVVAVSPNANVQQGVVSFPASIKLDTQGVYLPAGMTASVSIVVEQKDNVLMVPNRAVKTQGRTRVVEVETDGKTEMRPVTIGLSNDQMTEIVDGLQEGDRVVIPMTTSARPQGVIMGGFGGPGMGGPVQIRR